MSKPPVLCTGISPVVLEAGTAPDEMSTIAGLLAAILKLIEEDFAGINGRPVKVRGNMEEWQKDYKLDDTECHAQRPEVMADDVNQVGYRVDLGSQSIVRHYLI